MESVILGYECGMCGKHFSQKSSRNRHMKEKHLKPNVYHCEQCESRFSKKYNLQVHIEKVHSKNCKQIKCSQNRIVKKSACFRKRCKCSHGRVTSNTSFTAPCEHANETDAQSVAESALKELKQLQFDIQTSNIPKSMCFENARELTKIEKGTVQVITVRDNLYPSGKFKLLNARTITRADGLKYFICEFCSKEFRKTYNFLRHRRIHTKIRPFVCVLCKSTFPTTAQLKAHCSIHKLHEKFGLFHKLYKCPKCDEGFSAIQKFDKHISSLSDCQVSFECPKCFKYFRTLKTLLRHKHSEKSSEFEILKAILPAPLSLDEELQLSQYKMSCFECNICGIQVKERTSFKHHVKRHENLFKNQCVKCRKSFATEFTLKIHKKKHPSAKNFKCHYCNKCFNTSQSCRRHIGTHIEQLLKTHEDKEDAIHLFSTFIENGKNEPTITNTISIIKNNNALKTKKETASTSVHLRYKCSECEKSFRYNSWLKKHFKYKHTNELPFKCSCCCKEFRTKQSLESHLVVHATKRLKLTCQVCGRQYASSKSLKLHLRIHTQEKPFRCKNCSGQFRTSGHLIQHCKSNH